MPLRRGLYPNMPVWRHKSNFYCCLGVPDRVENNSRSIVLPLEEPSGDQEDEDHA